MFDSFLGRKFYPKCKTNLKLIKIRLDKITKRRNSVQKFFRADISDLLKNNLDINAYGRAEGLLVEINMSSCYEMIEKFCECISVNLLTMDKQTECPDECLEAVSSLMYAAARFADLPELRDLRNLFSTKYGNSLDLHVSKEFMERLKLIPPTKEMKFQLLQEIADEASTPWDSKALEQKLYTPPPAEQYRPKYGSFDEEDATDDIHTQKHTIYDNSDRKVEEKITINEPIPASLRGNHSEKKAHHYGLVPPPPYYTKKAEPSPAASSDNETCEGTATDDPNHLCNTSAVGNKKPMPKSVRRNKFNQQPNQETDENEGGHKEKANLQPPPYRRNYGDTSETRRSSLERERRQTRGLSLPPEPILSPRTTQAPTRAASFEPDGMTGHIHPKLPDYDELASRIASLTGR